MKYSFLIILFSLLCLVPESSAQAADFVPCEGTECSFCHLVEMGNTILTWLIGVLFVVFGVIAAIAGFGLVTSGGNPTAKQAAKDKLLNAFIGIMIVFAAWLLVDTIMKGLLKGAGGEIGGFGVWSKVECYTQTTPETAIETPGSVNVVGSYGTGGSSLSTADAQSQLAAAGIGDGGNVYSYDGLKQHTVDQIIAMKEDCNCDIVVTEATGGTHASGVYSHENGYKLDLRTKDNPELVDYVKSDFALVGQTSKGEDIYRKPDNTGGYQKCIFHSTHLDCQFVPGSDSTSTNDSSSGSTSGSSDTTSGSIAGDSSSSGSSGTTGGDSSSSGSSGTGSTDSTSTNDSSSGSTSGSSDTTSGSTGSDSSSSGSGGIAGDNSSSFDVNTDNSTSGSGDSSGSVSSAEMWFDPESINHFDSINGACANQDLAECIRKNDAATRLYISGAQPNKEVKLHMKTEKVNGYLSVSISLDSTGYGDTSLWYPSGCGGGSNSTVSRPFETVISGYVDGQLIGSASYICR